jgi:hypothetical protein
MVGRFRDEGLPWSVTMIDPGILVIRPSPL